MSKSGRFRFDGGAATYVGTGILAALVTVFTLGICYPFALVLRERDFRRVLKTNPSVTMKVLQALGRRIPHDDP